MTLASLGVPLTMSGLGALATTVRRRSRLAPVTATVVRAYQGCSYTGYTDGEFTRHPVRRIEIVYDHPADPPGAPARVLHMSVRRGHRPNGRLRVLVDPTDPDAHPLPYGPSGYLGPARVPAVAGTIAAAGLSLLLMR